MKTNNPEFNDNLLGSLNNNNNNDSNSNGVHRLEVLKSLGEESLEKQENTDYFQNYVPPFNKKVSNHLSTGQLNTFNWGNGFPLFTPTNYNNNNYNNNTNNFNPNNNINNTSNYSNNYQSIFSSPNFFEYENKNRSRSQEFFSPELNFQEQPLSIGITPFKPSPSSFRNSWDNGLDFLNGNLNTNNNTNTNNTTSNTNLNGTFKLNQSNNNSPKTSFFSHNLTDLKEERPKSPTKMTPSSPSISPFQQWAMNKSKKIIIGDNNNSTNNNNSNNNTNNNNNNNNLDFNYGQNERYADTDFSEHVEHPSRTLFVRNLANNVDLEKLKELFEKYGPIRNMYTQAKYRGFVMISFFDIRHAKAAKTNLQSKRISGKKLDIHFALPKDTSNGTNDKVVNQGTLVVFNLDATITNDQLIQVFGKYGEIKDIRETPNKKSHKFIEFFDVRDAQKALIALNKTQIGSKTIKIEPSRPGGSGKSNFRRNSAPISDNSESNLNVPQRQSMNLNSESPTYQPSYKYYSENTNSPQSLLDIPFENPKNRYKQNSLPQVNFMNNDQDQNIIDINLIKCKIETRTTLMIRNIPNKYTQALLLESIDLKHKGRYDFFYLPIDFGNKCNMGYAFINLTSPLDVISFYELWNDCRWSHFNSDKVCSISFARIQGRSTLEQHFLASSVMTEDKGRRPMFFDNGVEVTDQLILRERNYHLN